MTDPVVKLLSGAVENLMSGRWGRAQDALVAAGFQMLARGDTEGRDWCMKIHKAVMLGHHIESANFIVAALENYMKRAGAGG